MQDAGCGMRDTGCGIRDTGYGMQDARCGMQDALAAQKAPCRSCCAFTEACVDATMEVRPPHAFPTAADAGGATLAALAVAAASALRTCCDAVEAMPKPSTIFAWRRDCAAASASASGIWSAASCACTTGGVIGLSNDTAGPAARVTTSVRTCQTRSHGARGWCA